MKSFIGFISILSALLGLIAFGEMNERNQPDDTTKPSHSKTQFHQDGQNNLKPPAQCAFCQGTGSEVISVHQRHYVLKSILCNKCSGTGRVYKDGYGKSNHRVTCQTCSGRGRVNKRTPDIKRVSKTVDCTHCNSGVPTKSDQSRRSDQTISKPQTTKCDLQILEVRRQKSSLIFKIRNNGSADVYNAQGVLAGSKIYNGEHPFRASLGSNIRIKSGATRTLSFRTEPTGRDIYYLTEIKVWSDSNRDPMTRNNDIRYSRISNPLVIQTFGAKTHQVKRF